MYQNALAEVTALKQLSYGSYVDYVAPQVLPHQTLGVQPLAKYLARLQLPYKADPKMEYTAALIVGWPRPNASLEQIDQFYSGQQLIGELTSFDSSEDDSNIREAFDPSYNCFGGLPGITKPCRTPPKGSRVVLVTLDLKDKKPDYKYKGTDAVYQVMAQPGVNSQITFTVSKSLGNGSIDNLLFYVDTRGVELGVKKDYYFLKWLGASQPKTYALMVDQRSQPATLLPALKQVWNEVSTETTDQATTYLAAKADETRRFVSIFGLSIDSRIILVAGPICLMLATLYMLSLVRMLIQSLDRTQPINSSITTYPWIGLFGDLLSVSGTLVTACVLPTLSAAALLIANWSGLELPSVISLVAIIGLASSSVVLMRSLIVLRLRFRDATLKM